MWSYKDRMLLHDGCHIGHCLIMWHFSIHCTIPILDYAVVMVVAGLVVAVPAVAVAVLAAAAVVVVLVVVYVLTQQI